MTAAPRERSRASSAAQEKNGTREQITLNGMELSRAYFQEYGGPLLEREFPQYKERVAAGLVGEGSECLGFDDGFSRDHDFGPGFCLWLPEELYSSIGKELQSAYDRLPKTYKGQTRIETPQGQGRVGPMTIEGFYQKFTGRPHGPESNLEWLRVPESFLATATNGQVFYDGEGTFTSIRGRLLGFYPKDVMKKKLAAKLVTMAQSGQYNYGRCGARGDAGAAYFACGEFIKAALGVIFLLNQIYMPFYKWAFRRAEACQVLRPAVDKLRALAGMSETKETFSSKAQRIEEICLDVGQCLRETGHTTSRDGFLAAHGEEIFGSIEDPQLRRVPILMETF